MEDLSVLLATMNRNFTTRIFSFFIIIVNMPSPHHSILYESDVLPYTNQQCQSTEGKFGIIVTFKFLSVWLEVIFKSAVIAWKCVNGVAPTYLWEFCVQMEDVRGRPWLQSAPARCIILPRVQTSTRQCSFAYSGPAVWNSLPPALHENMSLATFKTKLKTYLFRRSQWLSKTTRRCCSGFAILAPWYKWLYLRTLLT